MSVCSQGKSLLFVKLSQQETVPLSFQVPGKLEPHFEKGPNSQGKKRDQQYEYEIGFIGGKHVSREAAEHLYVIPGLLTIP